MGTIPPYELACLSENDSWVLFSKKAFRRVQEQDEFILIGKRIVSSHYGSMDALGYNICQKTKIHFQHQNLRWKEVCDEAPPLMLTSIDDFSLQSSGEVFSVVANIGSLKMDRLRRITGMGKAKAPAAVQKEKDESIVFFRELYKREKDTDVNLLEPMYSVEFDAIQGGHVER
ncbi:hypothetical protein PR202_gb02483 [Eleusine coracana subsp. coracana]|uniref:Uncharacterized protein n=1 Tax=Eleusine coracana subsp. coracana TaxID=191504 RepID=A0AAV5DYL5_ELECO|nr:hypothetical protein PR202_gb02483 [Eleusine coracana subsp. coracana]